MAELRASLLSEGRGAVPIDPTSSETHQYAEASQRKRDQLREAFGIRPDYVDGTAFDPVQQAARAAQAKTDREEKLRE